MCLLFRCVKSDTEILEKNPASPCEIQYNIITAFAFPFSEVNCCHRCQHKHPSAAQLCLYRKTKGIIIFFIIIDNSFFKCGSLGKTHLMHFKLINIFTLMMHKVVLSVEK